MIVGACDSSVQAPPEKLSGPIDVRPYVTAGGLASLGPGGLFETEPAAAEPFAQITPETAREQALAAVRAFGPGLRSYLESGHGAPIDFNSLRATRVYYGTSAYDQTLPSDLVLGLRKILGPYYFVVLSSGGEPAVSVAVSAYNTNIRVENGELRFLTLQQGHDFRLKGIKRGEIEGLPVSPERAVQLASTATGLRIASAPRLQLATALQIPQAAWWRIRLERAVSARDPKSGVVRAVTEVVVGPDHRVLAADAADSTRTESIIDPVTRRTFNARVRAWVPATFSPLASLTTR